MEMLLQLGVPTALILVAIIAISLIVGRLYNRAEKDRAYVRTGFGGQKVVVDGGSIILPIFQSIAWVNLQTLRLDVHRDSQDAMITKDRMRVDIGVEFYVRVKPDSSSIALAAQTLGQRTTDVAQLRELVEAKFVDALRSVAATMSLADLQEKRSDFVKAVQAAVATDLELNGLELESASLTKLDQTDTKYFNPNNAFDAEGLAALTRIVEAKRQERNLTVRNAEVAIAQQDLDATQKTLEILRMKKDAELSQQRDIANKTAETRAATALKEAEASRAEAEAKISAEQSIAERQAVAKKIQESAGIDANLAIQQKQIEAERTGETLRIAKQRDIELADQARAIAVADQSRAESEARAKAEAARALATAATESVQTARDVAIAERDKQTAVIAAQKVAAQDATRITIAAQAEREAAENRGSAIRTIAQAEADAAKIKADGQSTTYQVEADGQRKLNEARNAMSEKVIDLEVARERLRIIPLALAEAVKPLQNIGDVKIIDMGGGMPGGAVGSGGKAGRMDTLVDSLLTYRANAPVIDQLLTEAGFPNNGGTVSTLFSGATQTAAPEAHGPVKDGPGGAAAE
jgi:flotillin